MSLRDQPASERIFASLVVLALTFAMGLGLVFVATRELAPPPAAQAGPPRHSRLLAVLDGPMAPNTNAAQVAVFRAWVAGGATREGWPPVEAIVANNCARCHEAGGQFPRLASYEDLRPIALEAPPQGLLGLIEAQPLHHYGFPLLLLLSALLYLRRLPWRGRRALMAASAAAVVFDLVQWTLRQGTPAARWAPWTALVLLAAAMTAQAVAVLAELWRPRRG